MSKYDFDFHKDVKGSAFGDNAQVVNYYAESKFIEITYEELESQIKDFPEIQPDLVNQLAREKLLVLSGDLGVDKNDLALQITFLLANDIGKSSSDSSHSDVSIKQWRRSSNQHLIDIDLELKKAESPTIFVLTEVEPKDVKPHSLKQIYKNTIQQDKSYVLISTESSYKSWHLDETARLSFFPELKPEDIYDINSLLKLLKWQLKKNNLEPDITVYYKNDVQLIDLATKLNTPQNIHRFVELFRKEVERSRKEDKPNSIDFKNLITTAKDNKEFIGRLYYEILNDRERLLALGLSFFNGLFEDQLFAALEQVVREAWQKRDPSLRALDYCDLDQLQNNYFQLSSNNLYESVPLDFKVVETKDYKIDIRSIKIISEENRRMLFEIAWESHRRQILSALDVLVDIVRESVVEEIYYRQGKWELYGDSIRCEKLRSVIGETLSDIGLVSVSALSAVQGALLQLAIDSNFNVRAVAASAVVRWYDSTHRDEQFFRTLQRFYAITLKKEASVKAENFLYEQDANQATTDKPQKPIKAIVNWVVNTFRNFFGTAKENKENGKQNYYIEGKGIESYDYIGATLAVTIGDTIYNYLETNNLSDEFYDWLQELSESRLGLVHFYFGYYTLFWVVPPIFQQVKIQKFLKNLTEKHTEIWSKDRKISYCLNHAIACSLAHTYEYLSTRDISTRDIVMQIIQEWYDECFKDGGLKKDCNDGLIKTVALTYGLIQYPENDDNINHAVTRLGKILNNKTSSLVRDAVVFAISNLTRRYFSIIESSLQNLVHNFTRTERQSLVETFTEIYLDQRANLSGGDNEIKLNETSYSIWIDSERPLTEIETIMYSWVRGIEKEAQKIALTAFTSFAINLDQKEEKFIKKIKEERNNDNQDQ